MSNHQPGIISQRSQIKLKSNLEQILNPRELQILQEIKSKDHKNSSHKNTKSGCINNYSLNNNQSYSYCQSARDVCHGSGGGSTIFTKSIYEKLYNYSSLRLEHQQNLLQKTAMDIKQATNSSKISQQSQSILMKKQEQLLQTVINDVDIDNRKVIIFEQLGRILTLLEVFRILHYDEQNHLENIDIFENPTSLSVNSQYQSYQNINAQRKFNEMCLHENMWIILSGGINAETVKTEIVYYVLWILLDPQRYPVGHITQVILSYIMGVYMKGKNCSSFNDNESDNKQQQNDNEIDNQQEFQLQQQKDQQFDIKQMVELIRGFVSLWKNLLIDQLAFKKTGYLKPRFFQELFNKQQQMLTFNPHISKYSYLFESHSTANFLARNPIEGIDLSNFEERQRQIEEKILSGSRLNTNRVKQNQQYQENQQMQEREQEGSNNEDEEQQQKEINQIEGQEEGQNLLQNQQQGKDQDVTGGLGNFESIDTNYVANNVNNTSNSRTNYHSNNYILQSAGSNSNNGGGNSNIKNQNNYCVQQNKENLDSDQKASSSVGREGGVDVSADNQNGQSSQKRSVFRSSSQNQIIDRIKILQKKQELTEQYLEKQRKLKEDLELKECTFKPNVQHDGINEWSTQDKYSGGTNIFERLFLPKKLIERQKIWEENKKLQEEQQQKSCTFKPKINKFRLNSLKGDTEHTTSQELVKSYNQTVGRLRFGNQERVKHQQELNSIPSGENYEALRQMQPNPPKFLSREKIMMSHVYFQIDATIGPGKKAKIVLHDGDDPHQVADNFALTFQLQKNMKEELENILVEQHNNYTKQKEQELQRKQGGKQHNSKK